MIDFQDKLPFSAQIMEKAQAAGHTVQYVDNQALVSDQAAVQAIINGFTLAEAKAHVTTNILAHAKALRDKAVAAISPGEMASWPIKVKEAATFRATGDAAQCPMLSLEATARNITLADLVTKVEGNSNRLSMLEATIGGNDGKHRDAVAALTTFAALAAYDYTSGWPEV